MVPSNLKEQLYNLWNSGANNETFDRWVKSRYPHMHSDWNERSDMDGNPTVFENKASMNKDGSWSVQKVPIGYREHHEEPPPKKRPRPVSSSNPKLLLLCAQ